MKQQIQWLKRCGKEIIIDLKNKKMIETDFDLIWLGVFSIRLNNVIRLIPSKKNSNAIIYNYQQIIFGIHFNKDNFERGNNELELLWTNKQWIIWNEETMNYNWIEQGNHELQNGSIAQNYAREFSIKIIERHFCEFACKLMRHNN